MFVGSEFRFPSNSAARQYAAIPTAVQIAVPFPGRCFSSIRYISPPPLHGDKITYKNNGRRTACRNGYIFLLRQRYALAVLTHTTFFCITGSLITRTKPYEKKKKKKKILRNGSDDFVPNITITKNPTVRSYVPIHAFPLPSSKHSSKIGGQRVARNAGAVFKTRLRCG